MRSSLVWLVAILMVGCCPCRHLTTSSSDSTRVEVRERIVKVRDTVIVELPAERVEVITPDTTSTIETSLAISTAMVNGGHLLHSIENKKGSLSKPTETVVEVRDSIVYREKEVVTTVEVDRELTWWQRFRLDGFWVLLSVVLGAAAWKFRKPLLGLLNV